MMFKKATKEEMAYGVRPKWPLKDMSVGDAIEIETGRYGKTPVSVYASGYGRKEGKKFCTKEVSPGVYRVWRVT